MQYFDISTIKAAIEHLQNYSANWLLPAFVLAVLTALEAAGQ